MTRISTTVELFFTQRLVKQRQASAHTIAAYRDTLRLLFEFVQHRTSKSPTEFDWEDLEHDTISAFLDDLELTRKNSPRTRNARLAAIRSLFSYAAIRHPEHAGLIAAVLALPPKRFEQSTISYLTPPEVEALLAAPDRSRWEGRRDHALFMLAIQTGLRVAELTSLQCADVSFSPTAYVHCLGKGRKERAIPLTTSTAQTLQLWLTELNAAPQTPLFPTRKGRHLSRDAVQQRLTTHSQTAANTCATLQNKRISPHTLRHTAAMTLLRAGVDATVIALWLGHADIRSTNAYLQADMTIKERALAMMTPTTTVPGRYTPPDELLAFLNAL